MLNKKAACKAIAAILLATSVLGSCSKNETVVSPKISENSTTKAVVENAAIKNDYNNKAVAAVSGVPELTVSQIELGQGYVIFANASGTYTLIDSDKMQLASCYINDDEGKKILVVCFDNNIIFQDNGKEISSFIYGGHTIHVENGTLYYDKSKVVYQDTSFSSYKISNDCIVSVTVDGRYMIKNGDGLVVEKVKIKDENENLLDIAVENQVVTATNVNNELVDTFRVNGDLVLLTNGNVVVNGKKLVPPGSNDIVVSKPATTTTVTTKATEKKTEKAKTTTTKKAASTKKQTESSQQNNYNSNYENNNSEPPYIDQAPQTTTAVTTSGNSTNMSNQNISAETAEMLGYVNDIRAQYGLNPLYGLETLDGCSQIRANELTQAYNSDHSRPDGSSFETVVDQSGLYWYHVAENIANGTNCMSTVKEAFDAWINSEGHRANILNPKMKYMAVAKASTSNGSDTTTYWEQIFFNDEYVP